MANFTHFAIAGLALLKGVISVPQTSYVVWTAAIFYFIFLYTIWNVAISTSNRWNKIKCVRHAKLTNPLLKWRR